MLCQRSQQLMEHQRRRWGMHFSVSSGGVHAFAEQSLRNAGLGVLASALHAGQISILKARPAIHCAVSLRHTGALGAACLQGCNSVAVMPPAAKPETQIKQVSRATCTGSLSSPYLARVSHASANLPCHGTHRWCSAHRRAAMCMRDMHSFRAACRGHATGA